MSALSKAVAAVILVLGLSIVGCGGSKSTGDKASEEAQPVQASLFTVPEAQLAHLQITTVKSGAWLTTVHTTGTVDWDADHTTLAITQVSGPISRILVDTGASVEAGDPLLYVSSPDVANAFSAYKKARNRQELAERILRRPRSWWTMELLRQRRWRAHRRMSTTPVPTCKIACWR
jgi:multidrug efflux pump subunit AcrA (membrane-fusion protein)